MSEPSAETRAVAQDLFASAVAAHREAVERLRDDHRDAVAALAEDVLTAWGAGGRLLVCGNGGSAADAQHIVAELVGRFRGERPAFAAEALTVNTSTLTAVGNDYGFDHAFARQVEGVGRAGDVLLAVSTSGNSPNCVLAAEKARAMGLRVHAFLGGDGGRLAALVDGAMIAPSDDTPRVQEIHILMGHLLCEILEIRRAGA